MISKCPLSLKCDREHLSRGEMEHLNWHVSKRKKVFLKVRVLPGQTVAMDHLQFKNSFRHPVYITVKVDDQEVKHAGGVMMHSEWSDEWAK